MNEVTLDDEINSNEHFDVLFYDIGNDISCPTMVKQGPHIFESEIWINVSIVNRHSVFMSNGIAYICVICTKVNAIYHISTHQWHTNSSNGYTLNQVGIIQYALSNYIKI